MEISNYGLDLIKKYEGFKAKPYLCPAGIPTVGYGTTVYPNRTRVKLTDAVITEKKAIEYLKNDAKKVGENIEKVVKVELRQCQFDALVAFVYNIGEPNFYASTILKKINKNANDPSIEAEFLRWTKARVKGKLTVLKGLELRRSEEAMLYFSDIEI